MILLSAGHNHENRGACTAKMTEYPETLLWANQVQAALEKMGIESAIAPVGTLKEKVKWVNAMCKKHSVEMAVEFHFNSAKVKRGQPKPAGSETLYYPGSKAGKAIAKALQEAVVSRKVKDRGIKEGWYQQDKPGVVDYHGDKDGDESPLYFLEKTQCPAIIMEPEFIQNADKIIKMRKGTWQAIANAISGLVEVKGNG